MESPVITNEYLSTLDIIVREARANGDFESSITDTERTTTISNIQKALRQFGHEVSTGQAEEVYRMYSYNKWSSWISGGCKSPEHAVLMLKEFCHDVRFGENHIGL
ncbi:hypothetical protein [Undibacterium oligocarboniphilum]|uniref:Uncharacterized protein n=1 Tax=Undibacterium oligocarboniphilum TaxID=666702 RepID=A0A850QJG4_9BURK|nr:hypothetical protein [Undibacterium oligocarboniphilum]MBC3871762.1 hypothetical protein [Undibacterium oligocarboniphilum]NVO79398.1 hypothetical protein [Undibacterium oligocarboniphilum]